MPQERSTRQKALIQQEIEELNTFFSADELFEKAIARDKNIGIATIYRYLNDLEKKGFIHAYTCDRRRVYSRDKTSHCHFICEETGTVIHFSVDSLDFLKKKIPGKIKSFQIEVRGICTKERHR